MNNAFAATDMMSTPRTFARPIKDRLVPCSLGETSLVSYDRTAATTNELGIATMLTSMP